MDTSLWPLDRIADAGVAVDRIQKAAVLIKVDDIPAERARQHPAWPLIRGLCATHVGAIYLRGAVDYLGEPDEAATLGCLDQESGIWLDRQTAGCVPDVDIILDMSNCRESRVITTQLASERSVPVRAIAWGSCWVGVAAGSDGIDMISDPAGASGCAPVCRLAAGLALQEFLCTVGDVPLAAPLETPVFYNAASPTRTGRPREEQWGDARIERASIDVVGAGGIGVHLLEGLTPLLGHGCQLRIFDPDVIGAENLAMQISYTRDDLGRPKAEAMLDCLLQYLESGAEIQAFPVRYEDQPLSLTKPNVRVVCPDNYAVRHYANSLSLADGIPLVEAGSSPLAAQQRTFVPGRTACLAHQIRGLAERAAQEEETASCARNPAMTLPGSNMIIGAIQSLEVLHALYPQRYGGPAGGTITYDARFPERFGITGRRAACSHV